MATQEPSAPTPPFYALTDNYYLQLESLLACYAGFHRHRAHHKSHSYAARICGGFFPSKSSPPDAV